MTTDPVPESEWVWCGYAGHLIVAAQCRLHLHTRIGDYRIILQDDAVIAQPFWRSIFSATTKQVQGYAVHPALYHHFNGVWRT